MESQKGWVGTDHKDLFVPAPTKGRDATHTKSVAPSLAQPGLDEL